MNLNCFLITCSVRFIKFQEELLSKYIYIREKKIRTYIIYRINSSFVIPFENDVDHLEIEISETRPSRKDL